MHTIRNPVEWTVEQVKFAAQHLGAAGQSLKGGRATDRPAQPTVRHIEIADLRDALAKGFSDFGAYRSDVIFLCVVYPVAGLALVQFASRFELLPLMFPLASGFALLGPVVAVVLYEMSRRREQGKKVTWADAFGVVYSPSLGAIIVLGLLLFIVFLMWLAAAQLIYTFTLGPEQPASVGAFLRDVFTTAEGWTMIIVGVGVGFLFAVLVLAISVVSFPLLLDRDVGLAAAVRTSVLTVIANPVPMAVWGLIVAGGLVVGTIPLFLGLVTVLPVLGHATWHLYRKVVAP